MARSLGERLRRLQASVGGPAPASDPTAVREQALGTDSASLGRPTAHQQDEHQQYEHQQYENHQPGHQQPSDSLIIVKESLPYRTAASTYGDESDGALKAEGFESAAPGVWHRSLRYDVLTRHGDLRFADLAVADLSGLQKLAKLPSDAVLSASHIRFYDTETTGLGTGAGTFPFLHAVGEFEDDEFVVHQYFLADYANESALLSLLLEKHFSDGTAVVSFNGKSFDWPLLATRLTLHRLKSPVVNHLDLLYPSRRLWRQSLARVSLGSVESAVLGLERLDDLPGKEAPMRYFEFVSDGKFAELVPVFEHNATDVCSLVTLATRLADIVARKLDVEAASEWTALGRIYDEWNESDLAAHCFYQAVTRPDVSWREHWLHSLHCKRQGDIDTAVSTWTLMAEKYAWSVPPCVELAKAYEHRLGRLEDALTWAREAKQRTIRFTPGSRSEANVTGLRSSVEEPIVHALEHRITRISRKLTARADASGGAATRT